MSTSGGVILAIELSQRAGGVAIRDAAGRVEVEMLRESARHDDDLIGAVDRVTMRHGLHPRQLVAVGISIGPGGFTGLRIAVSTAKMLAEAIGVTLVAVPSALVAAVGYGRAHADEGPIVVCLASKRESVWATRLVREHGDHWTICGEPGLADAEGLDLGDLTMLLGDEHLPDSVRARCAQSRVPVLAPSFDPSVLLAITARWCALGQTTDALHLAPLYPRPPEAVSLWERRGRPES
ncbi:MAG: tRNA (adenosine(37)-N6)-threonylcarbamoyltransferase complex dimerization subunit type 1 TsaB [Planctomycetota bacterium]|jgi:tRNA threonylcarbamoyl adenosine modification protein YeaZ